MIKMMKQYLYIMLGYPGSGKSYFARQLAHTTGATRISLDGLRKQLFENPREHMSSEDDKRLLTLMNEKTRDALKLGGSVIYDANVEMHEDRVSVYKIASKFAADSYVIWVKTPLALSIERNGPPQEDEKFTEAYTQMVTDYEKRMDEPSNDEQTIVISGDSDIESQLPRIPH
jgi:predicted kinase